LDEADAAWLDRVIRHWFESAFGIAPCPMCRSTQEVTTARGIGVCPMCGGRGVVQVHPPDRT
jgi:hypothetical protein